MTHIDPRLSNLDRRDRGLPLDTSCVCGHSEEAHSHFHDRRYCSDITCGCDDFEVADPSLLWRVASSAAVLAACFALGVVLAAAYRVGCGW